MKKRFLAIILLLLSVIFLSACQKPGPATSLDGFFEKYRAMDFEGMEAYTTEGFGGAEDLSELVDLEEDDYSLEDFESLENYNDLMGRLKELAQEMNYEITEEVIKNEEAEIKLEITYLDAGQSFIQSFFEFFGEILGMAFTMEDELDELEVMDILLGSFAKNLEDEEFDRKEASGSIYLVEEDGKWLIDDIDEDLLSAIFFGILDIGDDFLDNFSF